MLVLQTPTDVSREWDIILKIIKTSMPEWVDTSDVAWEWNLFTLTQLSNIQVWKMVDNVGENFKLYGYILTRIFVDDIFKESFAVIYGLKLFAKPSAEILQKAMDHFEGWAVQKGLARLEAITNSPVTSRLAQVFNFKESRHFAKRLL